MRVTDGMRRTQALRTLGALNSRYASALSKAQTGRRVGSPSADPTAAAELVRNHAEQARVNTDRQVIAVVRGDLELSESMLSQAGELFQRARELGMQGANGGLNAANRADLAKEVNGLYEQLLALANTRGAGGYLFAGSQTSTRPFDGGGGFSGDDALRVIDLGLGSPSTVGVSGALAFTSAGGRDVFADLQALSAALAADDPAAVASTLSGLEASRQQLMAAQTDAGFKLRRLETSEAVLDRAELVLARRDQDVGGADPYAAYSEMLSLGQALERAVGVTRQLLEMTGIRF